MAGLLSTGIQFNPVNAAPTVNTNVSMPALAGLNFNLPDIAGASVQGFSAGLALGEKITAPISAWIKEQTPEAKAAKEYEAKKRAFDLKEMEIKTGIFNEMFKNPEPTAEITPTVPEPTNIFPKEQPRIMTPEESVETFGDTIPSSPEEFAQRVAMTQKPSVVTEDSVTPIQEVKQVQTPSETPDERRLAAVLKRIGPEPAKYKARGLKFMKDFEDVESPAWKTWDTRRNDAFKEYDKKAFMPEGLNSEQVKAYGSINDNYEQDPYVKAAKLALEKVDTLKQGLSQKNGAGDISAVNAFQTMIDPGATVRDQDVELIQSAIAFRDKMNPEYWLKKLKSGDKLPEEMRKQLQAIGDGIYKMRARNANEISNVKFRKVLKATNIPEDFIVQEFKIQGSAPIISTEKAETIRRLLRTPDAKKDPKFQEAVERLREYDASVK